MELTVLDKDIGSTKEITYREINELFIIRWMPWLHSEDKGAYYIDVCGEQGGN